MAIIGGVGFAGYKYYQHTQATIATLRENNVKLEQAAATLQNTVNTMKADSERNEQLNRELSQKLQKAEAGLDALRQKFASLDLTKEAINDPNGLEVRIDRAVERLIEKIKKDTGGNVAPPELTGATDGVPVDTGKANSNTN